MKIYYKEHAGGRLILGDSKEVLKKFPNNCIDSIITDPPYGYSFMGKDWDKALPSVEIWKECLRVLKPGAFAFIMSAPRQDVLSRMIDKLEKAGFKIDFTSIYWTYATGFPKASNIGKGVDKRLGNKRESMGKGKSGKPETHTSSYQMSQQKNNTFGGEFAITKGTSALEGSYGGFQPKPAVEIIIVAMKPILEKTYVDQALKNKKGITWLDDCRIPYDSDNDKSQATPQGKCTSKDVHTGAEPDAGNNEDRIGFKRPEQKGRFPANLLTSDDVLNDGKITKSGKDTKQINHLDSGSYSRYFDLDRWWK